MSDAAPVAASLLRPAPFTLFVGSRILSALALQAQVVALGWQVYELTDSALALGMVGLVQFLPMLALTLLAGQAADRFDRRMLIALCRVMSGLRAIFTFVAVIGAVRVFEMPAQQALLAGVVAARDFPRATALASSANQVATICGPAAGGLLHGFWGPGAADMAASIAFIRAALMAFAVRTAPRQGIRGRVALESLFSGITIPACEAGADGCHFARHGGGASGTGCGGGARRRPKDRRRSPPDALVPRIAVHRPAGRCPPPWNKPGLAPLRGCHDRRTSNFRATFCLRRTIEGT